METTETRPTEQAVVPRNWATKLATGEGLSRPPIRRSGAAATEEPKTEVSTTEPTAETVDNSSAKEQLSEVPTGPRILRAENPDDLIEIPGERPRTRNQLLSELGQLRTLNQRESRIGNREQQIEERERLLQERERQLTIRPTEQVREAPKIALPERPADAIEGDEAWTKWQADLMQVAASIGAGEAVRPILARMEQGDSERKAESDAQARYKQNDAVYTQALIDHLPFDPRELSSEAFQQVNAAIRQTALEVDPTFDIFDHSLMSKIELKPRETALIIRTAFPSGSVPPGHQIPVEEKSKDGPLVAAQPKKPLPNTTVSSAPPRDTRGTPRPNAKASWVDKLEGRAPLSPVTIKRSQWR